MGPGGQRPRSEKYYDSPDTTSFSVLDAEGNAVCCTPTVLLQYKCHFSIEKSHFSGVFSSFFLDFQQIGEGFGTRVVCGNTGMLFNNGMRIGSTSPYPENASPRSISRRNSTYRMFPMFLNLREIVYVFRSTTSALVRSRC